MTAEVRCAAALGDRLEARLADRAARLLLSRLVSCRARAAARRRGSSPSGSHHHRRHRRGRRTQAAWESSVNSSLSHADEHACVSKHTAPWPSWFETRLTGAPHHEAPKSLSNRLILRRRRSRRLEGWAAADLPCALMVRDASCGAPHHEGACIDHSPLTLASWITLRHFGSSASIRAVSSSGEPTMDEK